MNNDKATNHDQAVERIQDKLEQRKGRITWTIELGKGETYSSGDWTIYAHDEYPRSSVLAGRERRTFIWSWDNDRFPNGKELAIEACKAAGVWNYTHVMDGGTTHVPIEQIVSHLPDEPDF